jgi:DNA polymerase III subunit gamma/tau
VSHELWKKYRPSLFKRVVGQAAAVKTLETYLAKGTTPHAMMFVGPSGCGKTTAARIMGTKLGCAGSDYNEVDCGLVDPIEHIRMLKNRMNASPAGGKALVFVLDEAQALARARFAQQGLLKILEDTPEKAYFVLCTTEPQKLIKAIQTRCKTVAFKAIADGDLLALISWVAGECGVELTDKVADCIVQNSGGSARQALNYLDGVVGLEDEDDQLRSICPPEADAEGIKLARTLIDGRKKWGDVAAVLKEVEGLSAEMLRRIVLGYCRSVILGGGPASKKAWLLIDNMKQAFFDDTKASHALLAAACYSVYHEV